MRILITGAGGNLGRIVVPTLAAAGHTLRLMDSRRLMVTGHETVVGDVRNYEDVLAAAEGVDAIIHAAALHGIHLTSWSPSDFWEINVTGTFHVYEAARTKGIKHVVLCSTMGVYGQSARPDGDTWNRVDESLPLLPTDVYGLSKKLCEELAASYARSWNVTTVALRLGMFVPESDVHRYGFRLLFGGVDDRDVAHAVMCALNHRPIGGFDAFNIMASVPFLPTDLKALFTDSHAVLTSYYPSYADLVDSKGIDPKPLMWGRTVWSCEKAMRFLGYVPKYNFDGYLASLEADRADYYPVAGLPWWGI